MQNNKCAHPEGVFPAGVENSPDPISRCGEDGQSATFVVVGHVVIVVSQGLSLFQNNNLVAPCVQK